MKGLNINISSCTSQESIAIISSNMEVILPSSSSSSSSSSSFTPGSRAIDRHNPIITDERRSGISSTNGSCASTPIGTPSTNHVLQRKPPTPVSPKPHQSHTPQKKGNKLPTLTKKKTSKKNVTNATKPTVCSSSNIIIDDDDVHNKSGRRSFSKPSDLILKAAACANTKPGVDYINPPESSRYLLDDTSFLEVLSDFDPVLKLKPYDTYNHNNVEVVKSEAGSKPPKPPSSTGISDQVVVLRVSLHCRGCERKMKKHLSRMPGVTSFNIDFAAKKVTVVGDVTPLGVLTSISKVKNAKLWTPATTISSSSSQLNSRNMQLYNIK